MIFRALLLSFVVFASPLRAETVSVAVAANALDVAEAIATAFSDETGHEVTVSHGATGTLYAQIVSGAPFDIFLSADAERPARLVDEGLAEEARPYAYGRLILVGHESLGPDTVAEAFEGKTVALADPLVAPYGYEAVRVMERLKLDTGRFRVVVAANIGQAAALFQTRNADFAFLAASQASAVSAPSTLSLDGVAQPIRQDAALLRDGEAIRGFWDFLFSEAGRAIFAAHGYGLPE